MGVSRHTTALLAVAVLAVAWPAGVLAHDRWEQRQQRQQRAQFYADTDPMMPTAQLLSRLPSPAGMTPLAWNAHPRSAIVPGFAWEGHDVPASAAAHDFAAHLRAIGAHDVVGRCSTTNPERLCRVEARVGRRHFTVVVVSSSIADKRTVASVSLDHYNPPAPVWTDAKTF